MSHHIAQLNIARMRAPLDDPSMADFVANLDPINTLGEEAPGFVWRLKDEDDNATSLRPFDAMTIVNMTVWESIDALFQYAYYSDHARVFRRRAEWFEKVSEAMIVLWWIPAGHIPSMDEAKARLTYLRQNGPTPHAFTFKQRFTPAEMLAYEAVNKKSEPG
ncbi:MAG: DUF3291 domain-containing protein [Anaerolineae bacterium]|nr:DUF3291 domain-containing protein [Anaerolineae bacterium]